MGYTVTIQQVAPRWIAVAHGRAMMELLNKVWPFVKQSGIKTDGLNVAIYTDRGIFAGAGVFERFQPVGDIMCVASPSGSAATVVHMGPYEKLCDAHRAIKEWCAANGHALEGTNWEVYGHHEDDPALRRTDVFYLLSP